MSWVLYGYLSCNPIPYLKLYFSGANAFATDINGNTALHVSSYKGFLPTMQLLIDAGVPIGQLNKNGDSAVTAARRAGHGDAVDLLEHVKSTTSQN